MLHLHRYNNAEKHDYHTLIGQDSGDLREQRDTPIAGPQGSRLLIDPIVKELFIPVSAGLLSRPEHVSQTYLKHPQGVLALRRGHLKLLSDEEAMDAIKHNDNGTTT